jgi:Phosphate-starvation-inducible E family
MQAERNYCALSRLSGDGPRPSKSLYPHPGGFRAYRVLTISFALGVPIVMLAISAVMSMLEVAKVGILDTALAVLDNLLLALIFVELIDTIKIVATVNERGIFIDEPFLLVGLIAVVRSILLLTANLKGVQSM